MVLEFTQSLPHKVSQVTSPHLLPEFWTHQEVFSCGTTLMIRRYSTENNDAVYIRRINKTGASNFQFPSGMIGSLVSRIEWLLEKLEVDEAGKYYLKGLSTVSPADDFNTDAFWSKPESFHAMQLWIRPYVSQFGLQVRMWNKMDEAKWQDFERPNGQFVLWRGANANISIKTLKQMCTNLKKIDVSAPPTVT